MKKSFKLKALVLSMLVMMGLTLVPSLYAVEPFKNHDGVTEENADFVVSYMADKTTLQPGDEFTVTINVEKLPENGKGIVSLSNRIAYDSRVIEPCTFVNEDDEEKFDITPGEVGSGLGLKKGKGRMIAVPNEPEYMKALAFNSAETDGNPKKAGVYATVKFRVKADASIKEAGLTLLQDGLTYNGFAIAGKKEENGEWVTDPDNTFFIKSNLSDVQVPIKCTEIKFQDGLTSVELDKTTKPSVDLSDKYIATPENMNEDVSWSSSDETVVKVSNGVVTAVGNGTANVTITCGDVSATLPVTVTTSVGSVSFKGATYTVNFEEDRDLSGEVVVGPQGATAKSITYTSSNPDVVSVDNNGVIRGLKYGTSDITVNVDGKTATVTVSVVVPLRTITLDKTSVEVYKGDKVEINVTAGPEGAVVESLVSAPKSGAEFAKTTDTTTKITVEGLKEGTAVYTVSANGNTTPELQKEFTVVVKENHVTGIEMDEDKLDEIFKEDSVFTVGDSFTVDFTLLPDDEKITDTLEEILAGITTTYDKDLVDVKVEYNKETGKGTVTVTLKAAGDVELKVAAGDPESEEAVEYTMNFTVIEPVVEEPEAPETGDMSVAMMVVLMAVSAMGVVASKKILVK